MSSELPVDPRTGWRAIAILPSGRILWPIAGGDGTDGNGDPPAGDGDGDPASDTDDKDDKETDHEAEARKWKALARKHEGQAKANATAAQRLKELEDADKSESQKAKEAAAAEKQRADEADSRALRLEVALAKGLTPAMTKRLVGSTKEELEADADELLEAFGKGEGNGGKPDPRRPKERLRPGAAPSGDEPEETDPMKLAAKVPRG